MNLIKHAGLILAIIFSTMSIKAQGIVGDWKGTLSVQGMEIELIFHVTEENGQLAATMDVPVQGAVGLAVDKIELNGNSVTMGVSAAQIIYEGVLSDGTITGFYKQAGMSLDLILNKFESKLPGKPELVSTDEELKSLIAFDKSDAKYSVADYFARPNASSSSFLQMANICRIWRKRV